VWRSLVAHLHGVQGVEGSNPFTPTNLVLEKWGLTLRSGPLFFGWNGGLSDIHRVNAENTGATVQKISFQGLPDGLEGQIVPGDFCL
jgi:hypothetical protein